ncbi:OmpH family outer membrane protein [Dokdonia sinensis]|uniref:OmpH family outer membrane protein n=1 Tax=Dokdonia sinensis TaxID=2479847 RepID=A0A3M0FXG3_9FLAO|nr:OmpH family outer membrane protein [Dokdonia sinensis]RMB57168.1 OmpH family outer membrane protein [Dokdonia sinensis]
MRTKFLLPIVAIFLMSYTVSAQRSLRIGYIDMDYILENVPEYQEASLQLDTKVNKWKSEIEVKLGEVEQMKKQLNNERVLLTKELIEEREEEIQFEEEQILKYQQDRFGPGGDLMIQKRQLVEPVQDQVFNAVQEIATNKKYDFVFDKSSDVVMLYTAERHDISDQVLRSITRAAKRSQVNSRKDKDELERDEARTVEEDKEISERQQAVEAKKAEREAALEERAKAREAQREARKKEFEERRARLLEERQQRKDSLDAIRNAEKDQIAGATSEELKEQARQRLIEERQRKKDSTLAVRKRKRDSIIESRKNRNRPPGTPDGDDGGR